jgi:uncharacterized membrane protein (UPF0127 family)
MRRRYLLALLVPLTTATAAPAPLHLPVQTIVIDTAEGRRTFHVEIAADGPSQERGLMYRKSMEKNAGMLFQLPQPEFVIFWMKNTYIPLDLIFVRADGTVSSVSANAVPLSEAKIPSVGPVKAVIEINAGLAQTLDIVPGDQVHAAMFGPH